TDEDIEDAKSQWQEDEPETIPAPPIGDPVSKKPVGDSEPNRTNSRWFLRWFTDKR
ncbi:DUF1073 domain-containing protein, partial [Escherichia coli]|nr:DUF1073 domain-containing protein [Escherichia coli]